MVDTRQSRAEYLRAYNKAARQRRRAVLIDLLGGCCVRCGAVDDLEFDHIDPAMKRFAVGESMSRAWAELVEEALKCQLLCPPCHREKGAEDRPDVPCGSYYKYWYWGCRCAECRAANARKSARLRAQQQRKAWEERGNDGAVPTPHPSRAAASLPRQDSNLEPAG